LQAWFYAGDFCCKEFAFYGKPMKEPLLVSEGREIGAGDFTTAFICRERISPNRPAKISFMAVV
jgi:hypothetical protein